MSWMENQLSFWNPLIRYMEKAQKARKILEKIVVQGNNNEIQNLFNEIWTAHRNAFTEDNGPTLIGFIMENMIKSIIKECPWCSKEDLRLIVNDVIDKQPLGMQILPVKVVKIPKLFSRFDIAKGIKKEDYAEEKISSLAHLETKGIKLWK